jgi:hypothetical protein
VLLLPSLLRLFYERRVPAIGAATQSA